MRSSRRQRGHLCRLNFLSLCHSEMTIRFSPTQLSRSSFSLPSPRLFLLFQPTLSPSTPLLVRVLAKLLPTRFFLGSFLELALVFISVLARELPSASAL